MALNPTRVVLSNGVTVLAKANHTTPAVSILVGVQAGGYDDPAGREGTAALVARVLDRGTETRPADVIADTLDGRGASLSVSAGRHQIALSATCLAEDVSAVLALVADIAWQPAFPEHEVATRRADLITSIRQDEDQPSSMAVDAFMRELYRAHPYARRVRGTVPSVDALVRDDLTAFHQAWFQPSAVTVAIVGDVIEANAVEAVASAFATARADTSITKASASAKAATDKLVPDAPPVLSRRMVTVSMMNKAQADVAYGFVGIRRSDPGYIAASVMNNALGQYAIGGRLGDSIRERQGMAYYVFSSLDAGLGPGPLMIRAGVSAENVEKTIASIDTELSTVLREGFTEKEIDESKRYLVGALPRQLETNAAIAAFLLNAEVFGLGLDYDARLPGLVQAVTLDAAAEAARRLLDPARATIAVAGPIAHHEAHEAHEG